MPTRSLPVGAKLAAFAGLGLLSTATVGGIALQGLSAVNTTSQHLARVRDQRVLVMRLDTRASELELDAYHALLRPAPKDEYAELQDDQAKAQGYLDQLSTAGLPVSAAQAVDTVKPAYTAYFGQIRAVVDASVADQHKAQAGYAAVQQANDATDEAVGNADDALTKEVATLTVRQQQESGRERLQVVLALLVALGALAVVGWRLRAAIVRPLDETAVALDALAAGDLTRRVEVRGDDEVGRMAAALGRAQEGIADLVRGVKGSADDLASSAESLTGVAGEISGTAADAAARASSVSEAAGLVSRSVATVSAGSEQMSASIREIAVNTAEAARVAAQAVGVAEATNATVASLGDSSRQIGDVVKVITGIAEQTNLLALNATIEAARAGAAGRGFAVVANEVKDLAQETSLATEDIVRRVDAIQADTTSAVEAIGQIAAIIARINDFQTTIASAVEEQTATTSEMGRNVTEAAVATEQIAAGIGAVADGTASTTASVDQARTAAAELSRMSGHLQELVIRFAM